MNGWSPENVLLDTDGVTATDSTDEGKVVSREFGLSGGGATRGWRIDGQVVGMTEVDGITIQVQQRVVDEWQDVPGGNGNGFFTATGGSPSFTIKQSVGFAATTGNFPFAKMFRVVIKDIADGETLTISRLELSQER